MFFMCTSLESIVIPNTVTTISDNAFGSCSSLTSVTLPEGLETIDDYSFSLCTCFFKILELAHGVTTNATNRDNIIARLAPTGIGFM